MAQKSHGSQHGTRHKLSADPREKPTVNDYLKDFEEGEKVMIKINPSVQDGRVHSRFHGRKVEVKGMRGEAYSVELKDGGETKKLYIKPIHLEEAG